MEITLEILQFRIQSVRGNICDGTGKHSRQINLIIDGKSVPLSDSNFYVWDNGNLELRLKEEKKNVIS